MTDNTEMKPGSDATKSLNNLPVQRPAQQGNPGQGQSQNQQGGGNSNQGNSPQSDRK